MENKAYSDSSGFNIGHTERQRANSEKRKKNPFDTQSFFCRWFYIQSYKGNTGQPKTNKVAP